MREENGKGSKIINYYGDSGAQKTPRGLFEKARITFSADHVIAAPAYRYTESGDGGRHELYYFKKGGKGYFRIGNEVFHPEEGDAVFVRGGESFDLFPLVTAPWEFIRIAFRGHFFDEMLKTWEMPTHAHITGATSVAPIFDKIELVMQERHVRYTTMTDQFALLLLELVQNFTAEYYDITYRMAHPWAHALRHTITNNPERDYDNREFAEMFDCSVTTIVELFRSSYGMTPHEYCTEVRLEKAALMLRNSASTVEHISEAVGFRDAHYFSRAFRKHYGQSPSEYRRAVGNSIRKTRNG